MTAAESVYEELPVSECLDLLRSHHLGRIAVIVDGHPIIFPVNYAIDGETVVFKTGSGTKLNGAAMGRVAFEIDSSDEPTQTGWSVIVQGVGSEITTALDHRSEQLRRLEVEPWVSGDRGRWVEILPQQITGRRLRTRSPSTTTGEQT
jgi:nitroimidazol reductase NimA-like FMN-containing flavoprotein (pyridoxamine 5'-phosphate oxidase superfamily)